MPNKTTTLKTTASRVFRFIRPHQHRIWLSVLAYMVAACTEPLIPAIVKIGLGEGFSVPTASRIGGLNVPNIEVPTVSFSIWWVPVVLVGLFAVRGLFGFLGQYLLNWSIARSVTDMRSALLDALLKADAQVYTRLQPGTAVTKVVNDPLQVMQMLGGSVMTVLRDGLPAIAMLASLFYMNWQLTLLSLVTTPAMTFVVKKINARVRKMGNRAYDASMKLVDKVDDITRAWRVVRSFNAADYERQRFAERAHEVQVNTLKTAAANAMTQPISQLIASVGLSIIVSLALLQSRQLHTGPGEFGAFITALLLFASRLRHLTDVAQPITNALVIARGSMELLDTAPEHDLGGGSVAHCEGEIRVEKLQLSYPGAERPALQDLDLLIPANKTTALAGSSGAGKSSIVQVLLGFAEPEKGRILLDGVDITTLKKSELRRQFAVVSQDIVLFDTSVADNVAYGQPHDAARLEQALRAAHLWDFVQTLPQGLDTTIGANGSKLSGGQRQRVAIARALYKDAPIWVFDEATSALDSASERAVQQALEQWQGRKTLIVIAHRLSTVRGADCIHVLADGRVIESGTYAELVAHGGVFANMAAVQH